MASISEPGGLTATNTFDSVARLLTTVLKSAGGSVLDSTAYGYDKAGERLTQTNTSGSYVNFGYDGISQLVSANASEPGGASRALEQLAYGYDTAHNLNYRTNNGFAQTFSVNGDNELTAASRSGTLTVSGATVASATNVTVNGTTAALYGDATFSAAGFSLTNGNNTFTAVAHDGEGNVASSSVTVNLPSTLSYQYDANGNLLYDGNRAFAYDGENQLVQVTVTNSWMSQFVYDGKMRRRIRREYTWTSGSWVEASEVHYLYDGNLVIQERDINNNAITVYTRGLDLSGGFQAAGGIGGLLARTDQTTSPSTTAFYHADGNGNVTSLATAGQFVVAKYQYDPYGNLLAQSGVLASNNLYRFSSKEAHVNSGLYYYGYRFYDPNLQRWLNRDPITEFGGNNLYTSFENNPVYYIDSFGLDGGPYHPPNNVNIRCDKDDECSTLEGKMQQFMKMINSHSGWDWNVPSPRGGGRHSGEIADLWRGYAKCQAIHAAKCPQQPPPCPIQLPSPQPVRIPPPTPQQQQQVIAITTGGVLIIIAIVVFAPVGV